MENVAIVTLYVVWACFSFGLVVMFIKYVMLTDKVIKRLQKKYAEGEALKDSLVQDLMDFYEEAYEREQLIECNDGIYRPNFIINYGLLK